MRRLLQFLALAAMMLSPMAMHGVQAEPAAHHGTAAEDGHCGGSNERESGGDRGRSADCAIACSAMVGGSALIEPAPLPRAAFTAAPAFFFAGTAPGSDPPPPRLA